MLRLYHDFYNKYIINGYVVDLHICNAIDPLNESLLLHGYTNHFIYTYQDHDYGIDVNDVAKNHSGRKHIHVGD